MAIPFFFMIYYNGKWAMGRENQFMDTGVHRVTKNTQLLTTIKNIQMNQYNFPLTENGQNQAE
jgi:hypothetical protein